MYKGFLFCFFFFILTGTFTVVVLNFVVCCFCKAGPVQPLRPHLYGENFSLVECSFVYPSHMVKIYPPADQTFPGIIADKYSVYGKSKATEASLDREL